MAIDPPRLDRERALKEDHARQRALDALHQVLLTLAPGERLGTPTRRGRLIAIPIERPGLHPSGDQQSTQMK